MVAVGELAPEFSLLDQDGQTVSLSQFRGQKNVVLYFYPRDETPICTQEACSFRDAHPEFQAVDAEILGISADDQASHRAFADNHRLPFRVLSDPKLQVAKQYGALKGFGLIRSRVSFVIDRAGVVRDVIEAQFSASAHVEGAQAALKLIAASS